MAKNISRQSSHTDLHPNPAAPAANPTSAAPIVIPPPSETEKKSSAPQMKLKPGNQVITEADGRRTYRGREVRREADEDDQPLSAPSPQPKQPTPSKEPRLPATPPVLNPRSSSSLPTSRDSSTVDQPAKKMPTIEKPAAHQEKKVAKIKQAPVNPAVALRIAITKGRINEVRALLGSGAFVDLARTDGGTPLFVATKQGPSA